MLLKVCSMKNRGSQFILLREAIEDDAPFINMMANIIELVKGMKRKHYIFAWSFKEPKFLYASSELVHRLGYTMDEFLSKEFDELIAPHHVGQGMNKYLGNKRKEGASEFFDFPSDYLVLGKHYPDDGSYIHLRWNGFNDTRIGMGGGVAYEVY